MVDNRSAGFYGIGGSFNFKSGDISGTAAKSQDDKMGPGTEYAPPANAEENDEGQEMNFTDRSAQLRATLNSLAMMNVANVINTKKRQKRKTDDDEPQEINNEEFDEDYLKLLNTEEDDDEYI